MRQLKSLGLNSEGLTKFYCTNIRSIIVYAAPAWYGILCDRDKQKLEAIQKAASKIIYPTFTYDMRCVRLNIPTIQDFVFKLSLNHFSKILNNENHVIAIQLLDQPWHEQRSVPNLFSIFI